MDRADQRRQRKMQKRRARKKLLTVGVLMLVIGLVLGGVLGNVIGKKSVKKEVAKLSQELKEKNEAIETFQQKVDLQENEGEEGELPWNLVLVNPWNKMKEGYVPELKIVEDGYEVDSRIVEPLKKMLADAREAGTSPIICSAYRSVERQVTLFNNGVQKRLNKGLNYYDAYVETSSAVAVPGTSEHALGLAVDIVSVSNQNLTSAQENTAEQKWLMENCHKYGFILRYPNGTTEITGIIYEPWHYRYVGEEVAKEVTELGITYEEYLEKHYEP